MVCFWPLAAAPVRPLPATSRPKRSGISRRAAPEQSAQSTPSSNKLLLFLVLKNNFRLIYYSRKQDFIVMGLIIDKSIAHNVATYFIRAGTHPYELHSLLYIFIQIHFVRAKLNPAVCTLIFDP